MNNQTNSIYETVTQVDELIKKNKDVYFKELLQRSKGRIVIFDDAGDAYLGVIEQLLVEEDKSFYHYENPNTNYFSVKFFPCTQALRNAVENEPVAVLQYSMLQHAPVNNLKDITLELIYTDYEYSKRGIGTNILRALHYIAINNQISGMNGVCKPYGYSREKLERVKHFYKSANITVTPTKTGYNKDKLKHLLSLVYEKELRQNTKDCVMNYPVGKNNYIVVLPPKNLVHSHYQGREQE